MSESVDQRACRRCGAQSRLDADFCWQCYTPFRGGSATFGSEARTTPLARAVSGRTATMAPREPVVTTGSTGLPPLVRSIIRLLILAGLVAGGWFAWQHFFGGFRFPDEVEREPRIEGEAGDEFVDLMRAGGRLFDIELEVALYGNAVNPPFVMYTFRIPEGQSFDQWLSNFRKLPASEQAAAFLTTVADSGFACQAEPQGAGCAWMRDSELIIGLGGLGLTEDEVRPIAEEVRSETE